MEGEANLPLLSWLPRPLPLLQQLLEFAARAHQHALGALPLRNRRRDRVRAIMYQERKDAKAREEADDMY